MFRTRFCDRHAETAPVDVVQLDIKYFEADLICHPLDLLESIVADMLMANGVISISFYHERQVALLEYPDTFVVQTIVYLLHKAGGVIQIIKHGDRRNDFGFFLTEVLRERVRIEKIRNKLDVARIVLLELEATRVHTNQPETVVSVGA